MPGYGISESLDGVLPWSWAEERLRSSRNFWVSSTWPDGRPHAMPVWAVWLDGALYFSTASNSAKARNLLAKPQLLHHHRIRQRGAHPGRLRRRRGKPHRPQACLGRLQGEVRLEPRRREHVRPPPPRRLRLHRDRRAVRHRRHPLAFRLASLVAPWATPLRQSPTSLRGQAGQQPTAGPPRTRLQPPRRTLHPEGLACLRPGQRRTPGPSAPAHPPRLAI